LLEPGETVDRYIVERILGDGGMAVVYLVKHAHLGSLHALKVLASDLLVDAGIRDRFLAEGRIQAQLAHPNVARVTDVVSEPGIAALVIEYIEGPTLDEWLDGKPGLPKDEILSIFLPVLDAVEAAHERGVLHRDLKPSNIILGRGVANAIRPVVLDFGIAGITDDANLAHGRKRRTRTGAQLGTPAYMSPEQVRHKNDLDVRTDIFSLGAILYELATGRIAFEADNDYDTLSNVVSGTYQGTEPVPGDAAGLIGGCIQTALSVDREERYADVPAFRAALLAASSLAPSEPISLEDITSVAIEEPPPRKRRWLGLLLVLFVVGGLGWAGWLGMQAVQAQAQQDASRQANAASEVLASAALATLELRQTDLAANADEAVLDRAVEQGARAVAAARTPEALGAFALASVLKGGWHLRGRSWDEGEFGQIERITRQAFTNRTLPETALARAIVEARACRLLPTDDARREGFCRDGQGRFLELDGALRRDPRAWLRVEVGWMAAGFFDALAEEQQARRSGDAAQPLYDQAVELCSSAMPAHGKGSVNDGILRSVCLGVAGQAGDLKQYMRWARAVRGADEASHGRILDEHLKMIFTSAGSPGCWSLPFTRSGGRVVPDPNDAVQRYCAAVGLYALDCPGEARVQVLAGKLSSLLGDADMPWTAPELAWSRSGAASCYLTGNAP